jgi:hypothetical protein
LPRRHLLPPGEPERAAVRQNKQTKKSNAQISRTTFKVLRGKIFRWLKGNILTFHVFMMETFFCYFYLFSLFLKLFLLLSCLLAGAYLWLFIWVAITFAALQKKRRMDDHEYKVYETA